MQISNLDFSQIKIFVFGDVMVDQYWTGNIERISPEAPVPVLHQQQTRFTVGGAGNVANNIIALGAQATIAGFVGNDQVAQDFTNYCQQHQIATCLITHPEMITTKKLRVLSRNQQLLRIDFENCNKLDFAKDSESIWQEYQQQFEQYIATCNLVVLSDYLKGCRCLFTKIIALANKYHKMVIIDPKGNDYSIYQHATLLTPNYNEFKTIALQYNYSLVELQHQEVKVAQELIAKLNLQYLLITKSEKGMSLYAANGDIYNQTTYAEEVFDVTGAGDTVVATLATALAKHIDIKEACYLANKAAGIAVSKVGTSVVTAHELKQSCNQNSLNYSYGGISNELLQQKLIHAREKGEVIVFTNGCFDILHRGHLTYLKRARELGDRLIVAVNTDASVKRLKGEQRPINLEADRMMMLAALKDVDWVVSFDQDTPLELIQQIKPDVLVKGGDYAIEDIVGHDFVASYGGIVQTIPFVDNYSTTKLIKKIKS